MDYTKKQIKECLEVIGFCDRAKGQMLALFSDDKEYTDEFVILRVSTVIHHKWQLNAIKDELGKVSSKLAEIENEIQYNKMLQEVIEIN